MIKLKVYYGKNDMDRLSDPDMPYFLDLIDLEADAVLDVTAYTDVGFDKKGFIYYPDLKKIQIPLMRKKNINEYLLASILKNNRGIF